ncbi:MAG TPA: fluoride efflux transporter CrcB [Candidatus Cloacimonadota bacterium]|nr:fluoride efflux transporter CrcB [Candidatus Cloacimonadota bacterium]
MNPGISFNTRLVFQDVLLVIAGGALGSLMRYLISYFTHYQTSSPFPYKTLIINVIGCFLVGWITMRFQHHQMLNGIKLFFIIGFLGAFTTFSTFSLETVSLLHAGHIRTAILNIFASTFLGLIAVLGGIWAGK